MGQEGVGHYGENLPENSFPPREVRETFESGTIDLPVYGVTLTLPKGRYYRYDGEVESVQIHNESVLKEFGLSSRNLSFVDKWNLRSASGHARSFMVNKNSELIKYSVGFIRRKWDVGSDEFQIFNEAHEQAHMIYELDDEAFRELCEKATLKLGIVLDLSGLNEETVCTIMGLVAMEIHQIPANSFNRYREFRLAEKTLKQRSKKRE